MTRFFSSFVLLPSSFLLALSFLCHIQAGVAADSSEISEPVTTIQDFKEWVSCLEFSPDGSLLAIGTYEEVRLWETATKKIVSTLKVKGGFIRGVAFSPDGKLLAIAAYQNLELWDVASRQKLNSIRAHRGYVTDVRFSPDGQTIATSSEDQTAKLWPVAGGISLPSTPPLKTITGFENPATGVAFSPDGKWLATSAGDENRATRKGQVNTWETATGEARQAFADHLRGATSVAFSPDGKTLASGGLDSKVNLSVAETGLAIGFFGEHSRPVNSVLWWRQTGGDREPGTGDQGDGGQRTSGQGTEESELPPPPPLPTELGEGVPTKQSPAKADFSSLTNHLLISGSGGRIMDKNEVKIWLDSGREVASIDHHTAKVTRIAISPDGLTLATASYDKTVALWDLAPVLAQALKELAPAH